MRYTNKKRKSRRKITSKRYTRNKFKGGEGNLGDFTETCIINPFKKAGIYLKQGYQQLTDLTRKGNEKIENDLNTLSLKLSKLGSQKEPLIKPIQNLIEKTRRDISRNDKRVEKLEEMTETKVDSQLRDTPSEILTVGDLTSKSKGGKKKPRKSKKKRKIYKL